MQNRYRTDAHLDLAMDVQKQRAYGRRRIIETDYIKSVDKGGFGAIVSAIFVQNDYLPEMALRMALRQIAELKNDIAESTRVSFCTSYSEVEQAMLADKLAIMMSMEDCIPLYEDLCLLPLFYELGLRFMELAWNRRNMACTGATFRQDPRREKSGLSEFGRRLVENCVRLGIILDVSHINESGFWDICEHSPKPMIASHSNAAALTPTERNLSDEQIREISRREGFIGVNGMSFLIAKNEADASVELLADHIEHIVSVGGVECVGYGFDFNDQVLKYVPLNEQQLVNGQCRDVIKGYGEVDVLEAELLKRGFSEQELRLIGGENFLRFLKVNF